MSTTHATTRDDSPGGRRAGSRSTAIFAFWTTVSRVVGLAREILVSALFGTSGPISAFVVAFQVPNLLRSLVADSALSAAFVPTFTELQEQGRHDEARRLVGALAGFITIALGLVTLLAIVVAPWVMPLFAPGLEGIGLTDDLVRLSQIMFPIVVLLGLTGLVVAILQAAGEFAASAFVPVLWNAVIILTIAIAVPQFDEGIQIYAYAIGILLGTLAQLLYLLPELRGKGPFHFSLGRGNRHLRRVLVLMVPVTISLGLININAVVDTAFASLVSEDAVRAIDAAFRLYILPQGIFSVAISTVLFPTISRLAARGDRAGMRRSVADGLRQIFFLLLPASAVLMLLATPIVRLVFERGKFDAASTGLTATALFYFTIGLVFNGASLLVIRAFFSLKLPWVATKVALAGVALNALLDAVFYRPFGIGGIPLSTSITSIVTFGALVALLSRELGGLRIPSVVDGFARNAIAAAAGGVLALTVWTALDRVLGRSFAAQLVTVGFGVAAGAVTHFAASQSLGVPERQIVSRLRGPLR